jgi:hypothetical protein
VGDCHRLIKILTAKLAEKLQIVNAIKNGNYTNLNDGQELPTDKHNATTA